MAVTDIILAVGLVVISFVYVLGEVAWTHGRNGR